MVDSYTQINRLGELFTPLGPDVLVLDTFTGDEFISAPFRFEVTAIAETGKTIDFDRILGESICARITSVNSQERYFTGTLTEAAHIGQVKDGDQYKMVLRPWHWLLTKQTRSQVFHNMTVRDIVTKVLSAYSGDYADRLQRSYSPIEYCVQHRETDFNFISRLLEAHGIGYFYEFDKDKQTLVLADAVTTYPVAPGTKRSVGMLAAAFDEGFAEWWPSRTLVTNTVKRHDYDFRKPHAQLVSSSSGPARHRYSELKDSALPFHQAMGENISGDIGRLHADIAVAAEQARDHHAIGYGNAVTLYAGTRVQIEGILGGPEEYLIAAINHRFYGNAYRPASDDDEIDYRGRVEAISTKVDFAPPRVTPKPLISGVQTGVVVGNGDLDTDKFGRIKVAFHWMQVNDGGTSMWCRVAQVWSGAGWGGQFIPRAGMEVLVQFVDGDPDQPVIVGTLYNGDTDLPFSPPGEKYTSGWRSRSAKGGTDDFNEISMKDDAGKELLKFHAQKDLLTEVENDETRQIDHNRTTTIKNDDTLKVNHDIKVEAKNTITVTAMNSITLKVGGSKIVLDPASITISAPSVKVEGTAVVKVNANGMLVLSGGVVKIN